MRRGTLLAALLATLSVACSRSDSSPPARETAPSVTPEEALEKARGAEGAERARRLAEAERGTGDAARVAATWSLRTALEDRDPVAAERHLARLAELQGAPVDEEGRTWRLPLLAATVAEDAAAYAREKVEGPEPDVARAKAAVEAGRRALARAEGEAADETQAVEAAARWVALSDGPVDLAGLVEGEARGKGPIVVIVSDHFQLGDDVLPSVAKRWARSMRVAFVGVLVGKVRLGIRRVSATPEEEKAALEERAKALGLAWAGATPARDASLRRLGIDPTRATVLVLDRDGRLLARISGRALDPRPLDPVVERASAARPDDGR
jgi:hypothetical protein